MAVWGWSGLYGGVQHCPSVKNSSCSSGKDSIQLLLVTGCESMLNEEGTKEEDKETRDDKTDGTERNLSWRIRTRLTRTTYR